ncbi:MAG: SusF/SusE family outer membrane protein [Bacteroidales bacterium]|nr:SusF/SusE family outer membrane protein [Bacteroidales bacterium]
MKRLFSFMMIIAAAAMTFVSCKKDPTPTPGPDQKDEKITEVYVYGAATSAGLDLTKMEQFQETGGLFTWEGYLKAGLPFKFPTQKTAEWPALMVKADGESLVYAKDDADVVVYTVDVDGTYEITIDTRDENNLLCVIDLIQPDMSTIEINELYILGDASPSGWSLAGMEQFEKDGAIFTWEGPLKAGLRFRFPLQKDPGTSVDDAKWWPCLCCYEGGILRYAMGDEDEHNVPVEEDGLYKIVVNTTDHDNMTYTIELKEAGLPDPEITALWVLGDAAPGGWALDVMPQMEGSDGVFTWTGTLKKTGVFRFNTTNLNFFPSIVLDKATGRPVYVEDWDETLYDQFSVSETAEYTVNINAKDIHNISVSIEPAGEIPEYPEITELYILGDATDTGWALDAMAAFTNEGGIFTWQGNLNNTGEFRFPTQRVPGVWWPCLCVAEDGTSLYYDEDGTLYKAYRVAETGEYKIVVDARDFTNMTCKITRIYGENAIQELYILGDATDNGWALDTMPAFTVSNGIFTWEGHLNNTGAFRFPLQRVANMWFPCLCLETATGKLVKTTDEDWNTGNYAHLQVSEDGNYRIEINGLDINNVSYTITKL